MSEHKDEKRLDDALRDAINTTRPEFDAEDWKRKHAAEYQTLVSRGEGAAGRVAGGRVRLVVGGLAVAAVILVGVSVLLIWVPGREEPGPVRVARPAVVSMMSLHVAYREGGQEGLEAQLDKALKDSGPRPDGLSMERLLAELGS